MKQFTYLEKEMILKENTLLYYVDIKCGLCPCYTALAEKLYIYQYAIFT